ncbi:pupal cuticle protein Edg-78E [Calliphora vicina]|uniref:pupal cuticle protein Edg-78E n=1 Tax=Calliphora vicina TaxID=7373 RepID=UPI00325B0827
MFLTQIPKQYSKISLNVVIFIIVCIITHTLAVTRPLDRNAYTIYYNNKPANKSGHFMFDFQTSNGITTKAAGNEHGSSGVVQYVSLEGLPITMTYVADSDGYHPDGEHIPKIPKHITESLEYIRTHPAIDEKKSRKM